MAWSYGDGIEIEGNHFQSTLQTCIDLAKAAGLKWARVRDRGWRDADGIMRADVVDRSGNAIGRVPCFDEAGVFEQLTSTVGTTFDVPACDGVVVVPDAEYRTIDRSIKCEYAAALAAESVMRSGHPWVQSPSRRVLSAVRAVWDIVAPGWTDDLDSRPHRRPSTDTNLSAVIAHYGIEHHVGMIGGSYFSRRRYDALCFLREHPGVAGATVEIVYDHFPCTTAIAPWLCNWEIRNSGICRSPLSTASAQGQSAEEYILELAGAQ